MIKYWDIMNAELNSQKEETGVASERIRGPDNQKTQITSNKDTSFNPERQGGRLLSALNKPIGIGNPYCN